MDLIQMNYAHLPVYLILIPKCRFLRRCSSYHWQSEYDVGGDQVSIFIFYWKRESTT